MLKDIIIRTFQKEDLNQVLQLFYETVHTVNAKDYNEDHYVDRLFTHKYYQGKRIASSILQKLEKEAVNLGHREIYTEASITAKPFFESKGFICIKEQKKQHNGQIFINYVMKKISFS
ncbi:MULTISPECIES: GNAT family N-acetyltransferase [unclassified Bacillus cereus group]|uniref:GNAT family N-acetyltransferase n=1 Tax=unclassified Bacillus cereus group TaxID=2750818 RepID=UPI0033958633